ncbi:hypothetical protein skT53_21550 [Effusibacillus dendaii]|uniref:Uncharacterized protein n=1 Tax=Effusibacillus dendaii TaxID=2743772 RepID=A0A7I8DF40_9BACL|nr:hypothetical protein skT53_21550 [Effusibacillus dendaii]
MIDFNRHSFLFDGIRPIPVGSARLFRKNSLQSFTPQGNPPPLRYQYLTLQASEARKLINQM